MAGKQGPSLKRLEVRFTPGEHQPEFRVGTLVEKDRRIYLEYNEAWIERGLELSPFSWPLRRGLIEHTKRSFGPLPGLVAESLPDGWGLLLMDRYYSSQNLDPSSLSPLDRLAFLGSRTMGALTYHPPALAEEPSAPHLDLQALARAAQEVYSGQPGRVLSQLLKTGGSPGGARPKLLVAFHEERQEMRSGDSQLPPGFDPWLVKFEIGEAHPQSGALEYAYSLMAKRAGIDMPETRLFETDNGDRFFGTRRFDRGPQGSRIHAHSFGNLIQVDFRVPSCDYSDLLKATHLLTKDHRALLAIYRQMVFNVAAHNRDDHIKNFAFLLDPKSGRWSPAPAYDLTFSQGPGGEHSMTLNGEGQNPTRTHLAALAKRFDISAQESQSILDEVQAAIQSWPEFAQHAGVKQMRMEQVLGKLNHLQ